MKSDLSTGLYERYRVEKLKGETDPNAKYFVLRLDASGSDDVHVAACQEAALLYAKLIRSRIPLLARDLEMLVASQRAEKVLRTTLEEQLGVHHSEIQNLDAAIRNLRHEKSRLENEGKSNEQ